MKYFGDEIAFHWSAEPQSNCAVKSSVVFFMTWIVCTDLVKVLKKSNWISSVWFTPTPYGLFCVFLSLNLIRAEICHCLCVAGQNVGEERIVGGYAPVPHSIKYIVSIQTLERKHFCGGFLINKHWVVTAAHCNIGWANFLLSIYPYGLKKFYNLRQSWLDWVLKSVTHHTKPHVFVFRFNFL